MKNLFENAERQTLLVISASALEEAFRNVLDDYLKEKESEKEVGLLTKKAVSERLNVDNSTLWRWDKTGYLTAVHIGRSVYYKECDVLAIEEGKL